MRKIKINKQLEIFKTELENLEFKAQDKPYNELKFSTCADTLCKMGYISDKVFGNTYLKQQGYKFYIMYKSKRIQFRPVMLLTYANYKEINKVLKANKLDFNDGDLCIINKRTNNILSIIPFEDLYSINELDLQ